MEKCGTLILQYLYSRSSESQDLALLSNTTSEELLDDLTLKHRLRNNALNMLRAHSAIPDTLASQRMAAERRRNVDNDIASPLVSTDVRDQTHSRSRSVSHHLDLDLRGLCYRSIFQQRHILPLQFLLEFIAEEGVVHLPHWMMQSLRLNEGDPIRITGADLPKGKFVKLQAQTVHFLEISDPKAV